MGERAGQIDLEHLMFEMLICCLGSSKEQTPRQDQVGKRLPGEMAVKDGREGAGVGEEIPRCRTVTCEERWGRETGEEACSVTLGQRPGVPRCLAWTLTLSALVPTTGAAGSWGISGQPTPSPAIGTGPAGSSSGLCPLL